MSLLGRVVTFIEETFFMAAHVDDEFDQLVELLNGDSTDKRIYTQFSDGTLPVMRLNQLGAGPLIELQLSGTTKLSVTNAGQVVSTVATGTAPLTVASTTLVTNLNANMLQGYTTSGFLRDDTAGQQLKGGITFVKASAGAQDLIFVLDANTLTCERSTDNADIFTISSLNSATRVLAFPSTTQVTSAYTPTADNDVARKVDLSERNAIPSVSVYVAAPTTNTYYYGWFCSETGQKAKELLITYRGGAPAGTTTFTLLLNDTTTLGTVSLLVATATNTVVSSDISDYTMTKNDHLFLKCTADGAHDEVTVGIVIDNS